MHEASIDCNSPSIANPDAGLPDSIIIGGYRFDVKVPDPAMLNDPRFRRFIQTLPGVARSVPMGHGGTVWLHPDHGLDELEHVATDYEDYMKTWLHSDRSQH